MDDVLIPSVDLNPFMKDEGVTIGDDPTLEQLDVARTIDHVCRAHGFIHVTNFGISPECYRQAFGMSRTLFDLVDKSQLSRITPETNMGYSPFRSESINRSRPAELKEAFNVRFPPKNCNNLQGCPPGFEEFVDEFRNKLKNATHRYLMACALALGLPTDVFTKTLHSFDLCTIRMLHYPPCDFTETAETLDKPLRIGEHTDFGAVTFLFVGENGPDGLQIKPVQGGEVGGAAGGEDQGWKNVKLSSINSMNVVGATVNTGALMARWTNDEWRATAHRVVVKDVTMANRSRYSIAYFVDPDSSSIVDVHDNFCQGGLAKKYEPISSRDYLQSKLKSMMEPEKKT